MKKSKILTPILTGVSLGAVVAPITTLTSCGCSTGSSVDNTIKAITKKLDHKPDGGVVTVTIEKKSGLDVEFVTAPETNDATVSTTVKVNDNNEFTVYVKFVTAPTTTGTSTFDLNAAYKTDGQDKTQKFENITIQYDISKDLVEIKDGYSPKLSPATGWTKSDFISKYTKKVIETNGDVYRDDLYTSTYLNLKTLIDANTFEGLKSLKICINDIVPIEGAVDQFKVHLNYEFKADLVHAAKFISGAPEVDITSVNVKISLESACFWHVEDTSESKSNYPVLKAVSDSYGSRILKGKMTGSFKIGTNPYTFNEDDVSSIYYGPEDVKNFVAIGLTILTFGEETYGLGIVPKWVSPYCRNVK